MFKRVQVVFKFCSSVFKFVQICLNFVQSFQSLKRLYKLVSLKFEKVFYVLKVLEVFNSRF